MGRHRGPLAITVISSLLAWAVWAFTIARMDPTTAGAVGFALFYLSFFAAVGGSATIIGLFVRRRADDQSRAISIATRQGALVGIALVVGIILQSHELLTWLNLVFLILALTLLELFIISLRRIDAEKIANGQE